MSIGGISTAANQVTTAIAGAMPVGTVKSKKTNRVISWIGQKISSPQNRLILGATALMSQPFIDLHNRKVDEDTRKVSAARTVAKILAGTTTGFLVRYGCIKAIDYCSMLPEQISETTRFHKLKTFFTPEAALTGALKNLGHYKKALGTIISLLVMTFTNFAIDAPLTKYLTNKFIDKKNLNSNYPPAQNNSQSVPKKQVKTKEVADG